MSQSISRKIASDDISCANLTIFVGEKMVVDGLITAIRLDCEVKVVKETPTSYVVEYPDDFKQANDDLAIEVIAKNDPNYRLVYTHFGKTFDANQAMPQKVLRPAMYSTLGLAQVVGSSDWQKVLVCGKVMVVEETASELRLIFDKSFANSYPSLCQEWVEKDSRLAMVETIN